MVTGHSSPAAETVALRPAARLPFHQLSELFLNSVQSFNVTLTERSAVLLLKLLRPSLNFSAISGLHGRLEWLVFGKEAGRNSRVSARVDHHEVTHGRPRLFNIGDRASFARSGKDHS
jgi:hypothetical protein